ncbi:MAG TPA: energy transducer TonB [Sphingomicrobium sp.]|nr:energy transducer TonB [Sphingomicrobium sp.]
MWSTVVAAQSGGAPLQPIKPWNLDYGETQCTAAREYGSAANPIVFAIRPAPNGETYELLMGRSRKGPSFAQQLEGSVDFGRGPIHAWLLHYGAKSSKTAVHQFRITAADMAQAASASSVTLRLKGKGHFSFSLANMPALLKGLEQCTRDLKRYWHMREVDDGSIATPAKGDIRGVFTSGDYPSEALNRSQEGGGQFLLLIDEKGKVAGCHVVQASGVPALDAMGCQVIRERAKFKPAHDRAGKPIRSSYVTPRVIWRM